jgi:outer membrane protein TolC
VLWGVGAIGWCTWAASAGAQEPLTLLDVLDRAAVHGAGVEISDAQRARARAAVVAARSAFDPLYQGSLELIPSTRTRGYAGGFLAELETKGWSVEQSVSGATPLGTSYALGVGLARNTQSTTLDIGGVRSVDLYDGFTANLFASVSQELLRGYRLAFNLQNVTRASNALAEADLLLEVERQNAVLDGARAYWAWSYTVESWRIAIDATLVAEEALRVGRLRVERGQLAPVEATRLEAALVQARQDEIDAENAAEAAANVVLAAMGEDPSRSVVPATPPGDVPELQLDVDRVRAVARAQRLELALARQRVASAELDLSNARHGLLPSVAATAQAGVGSLRCPRGTSDPTCTVGDVWGAIAGLGAEDNLPYYAVGGRVTAPLGNSRARGVRDDAAGLVEQRRRELELLEHQTDAAVEEQVRALQSARARMELADAKLRLAEETLAAEEALAAAGRLLQKDVLEARTEVARGRVEAARARTDFRLAQAELLALQGQLSRSEPGGSTPGF